MPLRNGAGRSLRPSPPNNFTAHPHPAAAAPRHPRPNPAGRLYQVEYAMASIQNAAAAVGVQSRGGIVIACEKRVASKLLAPPKSSEKVYKLDEHVRGGGGGQGAGAGSGARGWRERGSWGTGEGARSVRRGV